jgi:glycosyltransferase involved in cell wall biosynthesis
MNSPLVSVCVPNLNTLPFLQERVESIFSQSYTSWEMIVSDNVSDDGSWQFFEECARKDKRVFIAQAPREGLYANWNNCIRRARGKYVYIATSDDTMASDCLEKLVAALEVNDDCDIAHCPLVITDHNGLPVNNPKWPDITVFGHGVAELVNRRHVRRAPYDGLLYLTGGVAYVSITELLVRRTLFDRTGCFESRWGSNGDINWDMKAGLVANVVHVPDTWASWRMHPSQATAAVKTRSADYARQFEEMIQDAVAKCESHLAPQVVAGLKDHWLRCSRELRSYYRGLRNRPSSFSRRLFQLGQVFNGESAVRSEVIHRVHGRPRWTDRAPGEIRSWLESLGLGPVVAPAAVEGE